MKHVLLVDDDPEIAESLRDILSDAGWRISAVENCGDAERFLDEDSLPDVMLIDYNMPDGLGTDLARDVHYRYPSLPLVMMTGEEAAAMAADRELFYTILLKPVDPEVLLTFLDSL